MLRDEGGGLMPRSPSNRGLPAGARAKSPEQNSADWWKCMNHLVLPLLLHESSGAPSAAGAVAAVAPFVAHAVTDM